MEGGATSKHLAATSGSTALSISSAKAPNAHWWLVLLECRNLGCVAECLVIIPTQPGGQGGRGTEIRAGSLATMLLKGRFLQRILGPE